MTQAEQFEELYGPLPHFSEHRPGETIRYLADGKVCTGEIVWVCAPGQTVKGHHHPLEYIVEREGVGDSWPDTVYPSEIIAE